MTVEVPARPKRSTLTLKDLKGELELRVTRGRCESIHSGVNLACSDMPLTHTYTTRINTVNC